MGLRKDLLRDFLRGKSYSSKDLRPLKKDSGKKFKYLVADIETSKWVNFVCVGLFDGEMFEYYEDYGPFFDAIALWGRSESDSNSNVSWRDREVEEVYFNEAEKKSFLRTRTERVLNVPVFVHNGGRYDFNFFMQYIFKCQDPDITFDSGIPIGSTILCFKVLYKVKDNLFVEISFWDSTKLLPFSLANLTKAFDVEHKKLEIEYKEINGVTEELVKYLEHDCKGHYEVLQKFFSWDLVKKVGPKYTMASQAMQVFRSFLGDTIKDLDEGHDEFIRKGYFGGRTEVFKPYFSSDKLRLKAYDVNSLYPFIMESTKIYYNPKSYVRVYDNKVFGFWDVEVEVPEMRIPPLPAMVKINKSMKLIFGIGRMRGVWDTNELEYAKSLGCKIVKVYKGLTFKEGSYLFKDYVRTLYKMRMEAKDRGDEVTQILCKLLLNSLYGRFGITADKEQIIIDPIDKDPHIKIKHEIGNILVGHKFSERKQKELPVYVKLSTKETTYEGFSNVAIAAQVTSNARILMHKYYMENPEAVYYTDTDSIYSTQAYPSNAAELGALKEEGEAARACFILPKTYIVEKIAQADDKKGRYKKGAIVKEIRMKGFNQKKDEYDDFRLEYDDDELKAMDEEELLELRRDSLAENIESRGRLTKEEALRLSYITNADYKQSINEFTIDDFFNHLEGDQRLVALQAPKFGTFKSSLKKGDFVMMMDATIKSINSHYDKRILFKNDKGEYDTHPHTIEIDDNGNNFVSL